MPPGTACPCGYTALSFPIEEVHRLVMSLEKARLRRTIFRDILDGADDGAGGGFGQHLWYGVERDSERMRCIDEAVRFCLRKAAERSYLCGTA